MRGKDIRTADSMPCTRITPAYAGKSQRRVQEWRIQRDHPRLCGEKTTALRESRSLWGSPPPMRGKVIFRSGRRSKVRITPAYAGKSCGMIAKQPPLEDHPRLCGEKCPVCQWRRAQKGSPPPMRGKDTYSLLEAAIIRITPAYAGKSDSGALMLETSTGSPPPMRGKVDNKNRKNI